MVRSVKSLIRGFCALLCLGLLMLTMGCEDGGVVGKGTGPRVYPYTIVTTVGMVTDIVRNVAGDKASVSGLIGEGIDSHLYKPTRNDIAAMMKADVIFYCGLMLEGKMGDTLVKMAGSRRKVYAVTELIEESALLTPPGMQGHPDPHVWMDPQAWSKCVDAVAKSLSEYDAPNAAIYRANADAYRKQVEELHGKARAAVATVPEKGRVLITAHDAFNYFGRAYGFEVRGIQGISTESEAGLRDIQELINLIVQRDIAAVFIESSVSEKNIRALIEGAAAKGKQVKVGGTLYSDAMGPAGTYEGTYIGMIDHNVSTIVRALGGDAPHRGLLGKLSHAQ